MSAFVDRTERLLKRLDRDYGFDAIYRVITGSTLDVNTGKMTNTMVETPIRVRSCGLNSIEISNLQNAGLGQIDAAWWMRSAYKSDVRPNHILVVKGFEYEIIDKGVSLDDLGLLWTIMTRRRR